MNDSPALHLHRLRMLLLILLIGVLDDGVVHAATAGSNHEHTDRQHDVESRQFGGFNANAAFSSNFGSSNFGVNLGGFNGNSPTTLRPTPPPQPQLANYATSNNPNSITSHNSYNNNNNNIKETNRKPYNDYNEKNPGGRVVDRFNHRYPDGSYEYRYELADGTARYERGYFLLYDKEPSLVVVGYYSYRMPDGRYITVFYNADRNGYRQNQSITPQNYPNLPRSIDVPERQLKDAQDNYYSRAATTPNSRQTITPPPTTTTTAPNRRGGRF